MKKSNKAKLSVVIYALLLLAGVGNLLRLLMREEPADNTFTLVATVLFILSSLIGIVLNAANLRGNPEKK